MRTARESTVEAYFVAEVKKLNGKAYKFISNEAGVADRIVVLPFVPVWFVELKRPKKELEVLQRNFRDGLRERGHHHAMLDSHAAVAAWIAARAMEIASHE